MSFDQIVGGCLAVIVAGMPAMVALLKINQLHLSVNSRMESFIEAAKLESDLRLKSVQDDLAHLRIRNEQLFDHIIEMAKVMQNSGCAFNALTKDTFQCPPTSLPGKSE